MNRKWKTIRIFISSTFKDMHAERNHLVRFVFPELKKRCRKLHIQLIDVDLRWGVSEKDAIDGKALDICLDEIDSCRPFFIGLLGHRYGWVPPGATRSITASEIYHGVLENDIPVQVIDLKSIVDGKFEDRPLTAEQIHAVVSNYKWNEQKRKYILNPDADKGALKTIQKVFAQYSAYQKNRCFFFFRAKELSSKLAGETPENFFEESQKKADSLKALKKEIIDNHLWYTEYDHIEPANELDLEAFGLKVMNILWERIQLEADNVDKETDWLDEEQEFHDLFITDRTRGFVGRQNSLDKLHEFVNKQTGQNLVIVTGESGSGKSSLMARFSQEAVKAYPQSLIISHFVSASPGSCSLRQTLRRFVGLLNRQAGSEEEIPQDINELFEKFSNLLQKAGRVLIILDAVNQFEKTDDAHAMRWLPANLGKNVRIIISTLNGECFDALKLRHHAITDLKGLSYRDIESMVDNYLFEVRKNFPTPQIREQFLKKLEHGIPLYIQVALEELKVFGDFETLGDRIGNLPDSVLELFDQVLDRVENDFEKFPNLVKDLLCFIACGRQGMTPGELQALLKDHALELEDGFRPGKLPDMIMKRLQLALDTYLFERSGVLDFFHAQLKEAVEYRWLQDDKKRMTYHQGIARYFEGRWQEPYYRALDELPGQYVNAGNRESLEQILTNLEFVGNKCAMGMTAELMVDYDSALEMLPKGNKEKVLAFGQVFRQQAHHFYRQPHLVFQQMYNDLQWYEGPVKELAEKARRKFMDGPGMFLHQYRAPKTINSRLIRTLEAGTSGAASCRFLPDGKCIIKGEDESKLWDIETGKQITTIGHKENTGGGAIEFSPDGSKLVFKVENNIHLLDSISGQEIKILKGHTGRVLDCCFSPDGKQIVSASQDETLKLWDTETGSQLKTFTGHTGRVYFCNFSSDGKGIVSVADCDEYGGFKETLKLWDVETGQELYAHTADASHMKNPFYISDDRKVIVFRDEDLMLWEAKTNSIQLFPIDLHDDSIESIDRASSFSPDTRYMVTLQSDRCLCLFNLETGQKMTLIEADPGLFLKNSCFSPDGKQFITSCSKYEQPVLMLWKTGTGQELSTLEGHSEDVPCCAFSPDGKRIVTSSEDGTIKLWHSDGDYTQKMFSFAAHNHDVNACRFSPDGKLLVSASRDENLKLWDAKTGLEIETLTGHSHWVTNCSFSPDGNIVASAGRDGEVKLWDSETRKELFSLSSQIEVNISSINLCSFSPDGSIVASNYNTDVVLWNTGSGQKIATLKGHSGKIRDCRFSPDGKYLISLCYDDIIILWEFVTPDGEPVKKWAIENDPDDFISFEFCHFSIDGSYIISDWESDKLKFWDTKTGSELKTLTLESHDRRINDISLSPNGELILSASADATLKLWDIRSGEELMTFSGHANAVRTCNFSKDGKRILSTGDDGTLRLWSTENGQKLAVFNVESNNFCCDMSPDGYSIAIGTTGGNLFLLHVEEGVGEGLENESQVIHSVQKKQENKTGVFPAEVTPKDGKAKISIMKTIMHKFKNIFD